MTLAAPDHGSFEPKFEILCGPEADLLNVHPGIIRRYVTFERSNQEVVAERACEIREPRDMQRLNSVDAKRIDVFGIVGVSHSAAESGSKPIVLLAKRNFVIEHVCRDIGLEQASVGRRWYGPKGNGRLVERQVRDRIDERYGVLVRKCQRQCGRVTGGRGCALKFTARVEQKTTSRGITTGAGVVVKSVRVRSAVVV